MANKLIDCDINSLMEPENPMRTDINDLAIEALSKSISMVGLIEPIIVRERENGYEVIAGHRRLKACRLINMASVSCIVVNDNEDQDEVKKMHENSFRADVNPVDEAYWLESIRQKHDMSISEVSLLVHRSQSYVRERLAILSFADDVIEAVYARKISLGVANKLGQITDDASRHMHLRFAKDEGVSVRTADVWLRAWKNGNYAHNFEELRQIEQPDGTISSVVFVLCELCEVEANVLETDLVYVHRSCRASLKNNISNIETTPPVTG